MENNYPASLPEYKPIMEHKNNVFVYQEITPQDFSVYSLDRNGKYYIANVRGEENARLIVKAVNNHEKLIEALKKMHKVAINSTYKLMDFDCDELHNCIDEGIELLQSIEQQ